MPKRYLSSADTDAMVERVAPAILELLADGVPRSRRVIVGELAERHPKAEVARTLVRLVVTDRVVEADRKHVLVPRSSCWTGWNHPSSGSAATPG